MSIWDKDAEDFATRRVSLELHQARQIDAWGRSRRECLAGLGALGATVVTAPIRAAQRKPYRIDVHFHHMAPDWVGEEAVAQSLAPQVVAIAKEWTPQRALEEMDRNDVATAMCSVPNPGVWFGNVEQARRLARTCNDYAARMRSDHAGRFGLFAALPLPDTDGSLAELAYALDELKADGIGLFTSYGDKWPADPAFAPVFEELNRRRAVVYFHPTGPSCCRKLMPNIPALLLEHPVDTSRVLLQWIMTKSSLTYPNLRLIFSHAGGLIMAGIGRLQVLADTQESMQLPKSFPQEVAKFYYEISSSADPVTMAALRGYVAISHVLLGTDSPFIGSMSSNLAQLHKLGLDRADLLAIERDNAVALLRRSGQTR
jgi:6-methylsalicylate decarboxylase